MLLVNYIVLSVYCWICFKVWFCDWTWKWWKWQWI